MLRVTAHVLVGEIHVKFGTYKSAACNARVYREFCLCMKSIYKPTKNMKCE